MVRQGAMRAPVDGSAGAGVVKAVSSGPTDTLGVGDTLYFGDNQTLASLASGATEPTPLVPDAAPLTIVAAGGNVYWTKCMGGDEGVNRIPAGGGTKQHVADGTAHTLLPPTASRSSSSTAGSSKFPRTAGRRPAWTGRCRRW